MTPELIISLASLVVAIANAVGIVLAAIKAFQKIGETHDLVNSKMSQLIEATKTGAHAEGLVQGRADVAAEARAVIEHDKDRAATMPVDAPPASGVTPTMGKIAIDAVADKLKETP